MAKSARLKRLVKRIDFLEQNILPKERLNGNYSKIEHDLIRSFVLLVHAEFESYVEDKVKDKVQKALQSWITTRKRSNCLKAILAFSGSEVSYDNVRKEDKNSIQFRINKVVAHFLNTVKKNNGIKESDLLKLLLPLGLELTDLDDTWLTVIDSFGATRGAIAHNTIGVQVTLDRSTELDRIRNQILPGLVDLDASIEKLI
jgi:hypothetical protein